MIETQAPLFENKGKRLFFKENSKQQGLTKTGCAQVQGAMAGTAPGSCSGLAWVERKPVLQGKVRGMVQRCSALAPCVRGAEGSKGWKRHVVL